MTAKPLRYGSAERNRQYVADVLDVVARCARFFGRPEAADAIAALRGDVVASSTGQGEARGALVMTTGSLVDLAEGLAPDLEK
jgi:hypothetical protein